MRLAGLYLALLIPGADLLSQNVPQHRPRIALVLEGGGALGFAHIGAIQYLEEHHIPVDLVVGTSMGGLVGGLYAIGNSPTEIQRLTEQMDWDSVLSGRTAYQELSFRRKEDRIAFQNRLHFGIRHKSLSLPAGLNSGNKVGLFLDRVTLAYSPNLNFDSFPIPFRCVATDLTTGKEKIFDSGSIASALRATMSIPTVFAPVSIDGHFYTDGGAVNNLPVDVAKRLGADVVIAVYLDQGPPDPDTVKTMFSVAARNVSIMIAANEMRNMQAADILISADLEGFTSASFTAGSQIIPKGYDAARKKERMLAPLALNPKDWQDYIAAREEKTERTVPVPQFLEVVGNRPDYNAMLRKDLAPYVGKPIDPPVLEKSLDEVTGMGRMNSIGYTTIVKNGQPGLQVRSYEKNYGPPFLNLAINVDGSSPDQVLFGMAARLTFFDLGGYRAEWRTDAFFGSTYGARSEYYRPLTGASKFFVAPHLYAADSRLNLYAFNDRFAQYRLGENGLGLDVGYAINARSELRFGQELLWFKTRSNIGGNFISNTSERQEVTTMRFRYYGTDNATLPMQGLLLDSNMSWTQRPTGKHNFPRSELQAGYFQPVSKQGSLIFRALGGTTFGSSIFDLGLQSFTLGGPFRFGAYDVNELLTNQYFLLQAGYERKLMSFSPLLGEGLYAVGLVEGGRIYQSLPGAPGTPIDGSIALVARTAAGPLFIGASIGEGGHRKWWFGLGRIF